MSQSELDLRSGAQLDALLARQPAGRALLQEFYCDAGIFERDIERIHLRRWLCVGHASRIPGTGDWFRFDIAGESLILVRGRDGVVRALVNVCRHRGSRVCYDEEGSSPVLTCPYHAWAYDLDGSLRSARNMDELDPAEYGLATIHVRVLEGLLFVCFAEDPPSLEVVEATLVASAGRYGWGCARVAHRERYTVEANWKLVTENYQECYHCRPAHPEFSRHHASDKPDSETVEMRAEVVRRSVAMGIEIPTVSLWPGGGEPGSEAVGCYQDANYPGSVTGSEDGQAVAPLMGDFSGYDGGFAYLDVGPASFFLAYPDHGLVYLFIPREPQRTDMEVIWLVDEAAKEGVDYDLARLKWMWHVTSLADKRIIDQNQEGVNSRFYRPGPYGSMERSTRAFTEWYLEQIRP